MLTASRKKPLVVVLGEGLSCHDVGLLHRSWSSGEDNRSDAIHGHSCSRSCKRKSNSSDAEPYE